MRHIKYIGKAEYCFANSAAMLLNFIDETVCPEIIEVGCGIGLSAFLEEGTNNLFFSPFVVAPDEGLNRSFSILGFSVDNGSFKANSALVGLRDLLKSGPTVIGPIDMGYMTYNPGRADGADHFVLVYDVNDNDEFLIHDPYGYPNVRLAAGELLEAWRAEKIDYKAKAFQYWHAPKRSNRKDAEQIRDGVWNFFHEMYAKIAELKQGGNILLGAEAVSHVADSLATGSLAEAGEKFLTGFQLPLAAKRANDYASFFVSSRPEFAACKFELAETFGKAHSWLVAGNKAAASKAFKNIASLEERVAGLLH